MTDDSGVDPAEPQLGRPPAPHEVNPPKPARTAPEPGNDKAIRRLQAELAKWQQEASRLSTVAKARGDEIKQMRDTVRAASHRPVFEAEARKIGLQEAALVHAWQLSGYKPDKDDADPKAIGEALKRLKESAPYMFAVAAESPGEQQKPQPLDPAKIPPSGKIAGAGVPSDPLNYEGLDPRNPEAILAFTRAARDTGRRAG